MSPENEREQGEHREAQHKTTGDGSLLFILN